MNKLSFIIFISESPSERKGFTKQGASCAFNSDTVLRDLLIFFTDTFFIKEGTGNILTCKYLEMDAIDLFDAESPPLVS